MPSNRNGAHFEPGTRAILEELRYLRVEMRADRRQAAADRRRADVHFQRIFREFREDSTRRDAALQRALAGIGHAFKDVRAVGLSIVKTLNHHTRILERIDRKLGAPRHNGPRP